MRDENATAVRRFRDDRTSPPFGTNRDGGGLSRGI